MNFVTYSFETEFLYTGKVNSLGINTGHADPVGNKHSLHTAAVA